MDSATENNVLLARQAIYDQKLNIFGYELLFRALENMPNIKNANTADIGLNEGDRATSEVIVHAFTNFGIENLIGKCKAFINFTRNYISQDLVSPLPPNQTIIEVLEDIVIDDEIYVALKNIAKRGYNIALDDFVLTDQNQRLLEFANYVKIDILAHSEQSLQNLLRQLQDYRGKLVAEKVETFEQFERCKKLGFDYFQGYFLSKPKLISGQNQQVNRTVLFEILSALHDKNTDFQKIENILVKDTVLAVKLVKIVNSPIYRTSKEINSIKEALLRLGLDQIRRWAVILTFASINAKSSDLTIRSLIRGKMCQELSPYFDLDAPDASFTVGLFSLLDAMLDQQMDDILQELNIAPEIKSAIIEREGSLGHVLDTVIHYERGEWDALNLSQISGEQLKQAYLDSISWSKELSTTID